MALVKVVPGFLVETDPIRPLSRGGQGKGGGMITGGKHMRELLGLTLTEKPAALVKKADLQDGQF